MDIGVDASAAHNRATIKKRQRVSSTRKRAKRAGFLSRRNAKARRIAFAGVHIAQIYGYTAVGMAPTAVNMCKTNVAEATGLTGLGACVTAIVKWVFRRGGLANTSADPRVTIPLQQVKSWVEVWSRLSPPSRERIRKICHKLY